jgi:hypothetical protein
MLPPDTVTHRIEENGKRQRGFEGIGYPSIIASWQSI